MPLLKPEACRGCPFYTKGQYYVPDHIVPHSEIMLITQNPGQNEIDGHKLIKRHWLGGSRYQDEVEHVKPQPLIGATGKKLDEDYLPLVKLKRSEVSVGNAIRCRPGRELGLAADELPTVTNKMSLESSKTDIVTAIRHCAKAHLKIPPETKTIMAMGSLALYQLTGQHGGTEWRGYVIRTTRDNIYSSRRVGVDTYHDVLRPISDDEIDVFVTMHIAALNKPTNKRYSHAVLRDFYKLGRFIRREWPLPLPTWSDKPPKQWPAYSAFDTEYVPETNQLIRWSLCDDKNNLYCVESSHDGVTTIPIRPNTTVVIQNALADISHLATLVAMDTIKVEDLMLAHATLWTGEPHGLNYINSIFGAFNRYKHLIDTHGQEQLYSALDAYEPMYCWRHGIIPEFKKDPISHKIYKERMLPLIPIIDESQQTGARLNGQRLFEIQEIYRKRLDEIIAEAREITGNPRFNIGGLKEMGKMVYG